ncbi:MAG: HD-GYP domain-containing protein [Chloroflexi bacterium]|nr:HD-GYP domain-containing protein [Chloroflexota bacterium]
MMETAETRTEYVQMQTSMVERALVAALDRRDAGTATHSKRVSKLGASLGETLGLPAEQVRTLELAALFHDIGKLFVSDEVLLKPGPLTEEEWTEMKQHPVHGYRILNQVRDFSPVAKAVYSHHERFDGSGYPRGLRGRRIPIEARVCAVIDAYDAMTSDRPYRPAMPHEEAVAELRRGAGTQFDSDVVEAFLELPPSLLIEETVLA